MNHVTAAKEILDTMLGYLGFVVRIEVDAASPEPGLLVFSEEGELLIGKDGDRLDDIQYLVNRLLQRQDQAAPRVRVDINHYRSMSEDRLIEEAERLAQRVIHTGRPARMLTGAVYVYGKLDLDTGNSPYGQTAYRMTAEAIRPHR